MRARWTSRIGARSRVLVVGTVALALLVPGAAVAAGPADAAPAGAPAPTPPAPPGALPVVTAPALPARAQALLDRLPPIRPRVVAQNIHSIVPPFFSPSGMVVGTGWTGGDFHAFRALDGMQSFPPVRYPYVTYPVAVNAKNQIAVRYHLTYDDAEARSGRYPAIWHPDGTFEELPNTRFWAGSVEAIDDDGVVYGSQELPGATPDDWELTAVRWRDGQIERIGPAVYPSSAHDVNAHGVVLGSAGPSTARVGWTLLDGEVTYLPVTEGVTSHSTRQLNDRGDVIGGIRWPGGTGGAVWYGGTTLRYVADVGLGDINEAGTAVGTRHRTRPDGRTEPVVVDRHRATLLPTGDDLGGRATAINELGVVTGFEWADQDARDERPVVWVRGVRVPLAAPAGWDVLYGQATDVDERGRVLGWWVTSDHQTRAVVWDLLPTAQQVERWLR